LDKPQHQGKFHLLAIFLIPGFLVTLFLSSHWVFPLVYAGIAGVVTWMVLKKR
jgi:hypothetical protein